MVLPSEIQAIIRATEEGAKTWLGNVTAGAAQGAAHGAAESFASVETWRKRMTELNGRWGQGALSTLDFKRACESEREALAFNLASIPGEEKKAFLSGLLGASLDFLGRIIGAGLAAVKG